MINNLYYIGLTSLQNSQVAISNASNNIANADTEGYQKTEVTYETGDSITVNGVTVGTGASVQSIQSTLDEFIEAQYLDASADLSRYSSALEYLSQLDSLLDQSDGGLSDTLEEFWSAWNDLASDPDSLSAREALLGVSETLASALNSTAEELELVEDTINDDIQSQIEDANDLIEDIAKLNAAIAQNPDDTQSISERSQLIRELDAIIGVSTIEQEDGTITVQTEGGKTLIDGTETHSLKYATARSTESLMRTSDYDGEIKFSGSSSEEILIEFVSSGTDGTAQFKVSLDGGESWVEDDDGNTMLYTAGDEDNSVEIEGVEIWFDGGTAAHEAGDRYTVMAKSGLYWESSSGSLINITPLTDSSGDDVSGRTASGSLAGLFTARDDTVVPTEDALDELAESIIWEVNSVHATGAGLEHHTGLTASYSVDDETAALSNSGLNFADRIQDGEIELYIYDEDGDVTTTALIDVDDSYSLDDIAQEINSNSGGYLTATITDGQLILSSTGDYSFEIASDSSNLMAALGMNTYFSGTDAGTISIDSYVAEDISHVNSGVVNDDGTISSGDNTVAETIAGLSDETVTIDGKQTTIGEFFAAIVSDVGSAVSTTELQQTYASTSADYYYNQQASASEVNVDEELVDLTRHQQAYQAAAEIISVTQEMMDIILDLL